MNSLIESLNQWGESFLSFAWPMLWQSSLLIAALFAFDLLFRRKLRASIRYALWLVVLVKLCVPPTLALPTSPAWWLHQTPPPVMAKPLPHYTVTYDNAPMPEMPQVPLPAFVPLKPKPTNAAWLLFASVAVSSALFVWLLLRWWQITRQVRRAAMSERLTALTDEAQQSLGMKSNVQVKLTTNSMSPAVCGLFRPAILIPQSLAENFSDEQLRAVLLHELIHLRRRDVWVNFLQALLQIFYWWHPLLWVANARIRRVREEAVDDAVMLALRDDADHYAPTLLEVAKLALNRPLVSLGLVGIMESRHALRQRIERLVDFRAPCHAGLTLVSLLGILTFTAVAVPMGEGPAPVEKESASAALNTNVSTNAVSEMLTNSNSRTVLRALEQRNTFESLGEPEVITTAGRHAQMRAQNLVENVVAQTSQPLGVASKTNLPMVLITAEIYQMRAAEFEKVVERMDSVNVTGGKSFAGTVTADHLTAVQDKIKSFGLKPFSRPRIQTSHGKSAKFFNGYVVVGYATNGVEFDSLPLVGNQVVELTFSLNILGDLTKDGTNLIGKAKHTANGRVTAENHGGLVVCADNPDGSVKTKFVAVIGVEILTNSPPPHFQERLQTIIRRAGDTNSAVGVETLLQSAKLLYEMGKLEEALAKFHEVLAIDSSNSKAMYYDGLIQQSRSQSKYNVRGAGRKAIVSKLEHIRLDTFSSAGLPLGEVLRQLAEQSRLRDTNHAGINFLINDHEDNSGVPATTINPLTGMPILVKTIPSSGQPPQTNPATGIGYNSADVPVTVAAMQEVTLADVLDAVVVGASRPIKYSIQDYGVRFSVHDPSAPLFYTRSFKTDTNIFPSNLMRQAVASGCVIPKNPTNFIPLALLSVFTNAGVDLKSPPGKSVYYNYSHGVVFVRATAKDLDLIDSTVQKLNGSPPQIGSPPPQIHIKARFIEVPKSALDNLDGFYKAAGSTAGFTGILSSTNMRVALRALASLKTIKVLGEPEVVSTSGRQCQVRATQVISFITNAVLETNSTNGDSAITIKTAPFETGPVFDVVPTVLADGYALDLGMTASLAEFWGYAQVPSNAVPQTATNSVGETIVLPTFWPVMESRQESAHVVLFDGQTAVLSLNHPEQVRFAAPDAKREEVVANWIRDGKKKNHVEGNEILVFVTANIVDPAGNRVHGDDDLPFAQKGVPPQPAK